MSYLASQPIIAAVVVAVVFVVRLKLPFSRPHPHMHPRLLYPLLYLSPGRMRILQVLFLPLSSLSPCPTRRRRSRS